MCSFNSPPLSIGVVKTNRILSCFLPEGSTGSNLRHADDDEPFAALVFKIMTDPFVGRLAFIRIYSGDLATGTSVMNVATGKSERIGRLLKMHANKREELSEVYSGDICAAVGLRNASTGDTLCDRKHLIVLEAMQFPEPVIAVAIEPKTTADQDNLANSLTKLTQEDPTFRVSVDEETGQTIISGMGELHLEIIIDRLMREFKIGAKVGRPQVAYREAITGEAKGRGSVHTPDRGQGPVWSRQDPHLAVERRRRLRLRRRDQRGCGSARIHPPGRDGNP